jgi:acylphosphatase
VSAEPPGAAGVPRPTDPDVVRLEATVIGRVQGVGFRYFARREAQALGLDGWVANESNGSVRCVAEGPRDQLEAFLAQLRDGPPGAFVERVVDAWLPATGTLGSFGVRSGGHQGD